MCMCVCVCVCVCCRALDRQREAQRSHTLDPESPEQAGGRPRLELGPQPDSCTLRLPNSETLHGMGSESSPLLPATCTALSARWGLPSASSRRCIRPRSKREEAEVPAAAGMPLRS